MATITTLLTQDLLNLIQAEFDSDFKDELLSLSNLIRRNPKSEELRMTRKQEVTVVVTERENEITLRVQEYPEMKETVLVKDIRKIAEQLTDAANWINASLQDKGEQETPRTLYKASVRGASIPARQRITASTPAPARKRLVDAPKCVKCGKHVKADAAVTEKPKNRVTDAHDPVKAIPKTTIVWGDGTDMDKSIMQELLKSNVIEDNEVKQSYKWHKRNGERLANYGVNVFIIAAKSSQAAQDKAVAMGPNVELMEHPTPLCKFTAGNEQMSLFTVTTFDIDQVDLIAN